MDYPSEYEYDDTIMTVMRNALENYFNDKFHFVKFYKMNDKKNYIGKVDGTVFLILNREHEMPIQIKRSDKYRNTFSIGEKAMKSYLENDYEIEALLVGTAWDRNMYLFYWRDFIDLAKENAHLWKKPNLPFYVIDLEQLESLYSQQVPYLEEDYAKMVQIWDNAK